MEFHPKETLVNLANRAACLAYTAMIRWQLGRENWEPLYRIPKDLRPHARYILQMDSLRNAEQPPDSSPTKWV